MQIIYNKEEAVNLLLQQELVVIFQGHSEWGPRALGNRSMLFDPRNKNAKEIVNKVKGRQWWRPTAATILYEHRHDYLDMHTLDESPYMTFAIDAKQKAINKVPACVHVDNTCRFQTLKREQNPNYYDLINLLAPVNTSLDTTNSRHIFLHCITRINVLCGASVIIFIMNKSLF